MKGGGEFFNVYHAKIYPIQPILGTGFMLTVLTQLKDIAIQNRRLLNKCLLRHATLSTRQTIE